MITIKDYMAISTITKTFEDNPDKINRELIKHFKLENMLYKDSLVFISKIIEEINQPNYIFNKTFKHKDIEFGFIPNLDEITVGEYLDIDEYQKDENNIHRLMSILYRPITKKKGPNYQIETYSGTDKCETMLDVPVSYYLGAMVFFWTLSTQL